MSRSKVLLIDDDPVQAGLLGEALERGGRALKVACVLRGAQALPYLRRQGPFESALRPDLLMLDLRSQAFAVLDGVKEDPALKRLPVIVLSSGALPQEIKRAYLLGANCCLAKPQGAAALKAVVDGVGLFWSRFSGQAV